VLTKDLLRVSRSGGGYHPQFVDRSARPLAARVFGVFQGHVGERRAALEESLSALERDEPFKLVRGFAALLERDATFETRSALPPERVRRATFSAAEDVGGVATREERRAALSAAADRLGVEADAVEAALYADRDRNQVLTAFDPRWDPDSLLDQYNLSLAQTALFDATEVRVRSDDPRTLVSAVKRHGLMYEVVVDDGTRTVVVTGPDSLFRRTRRYGTGFARLLRSVAAGGDWDLTATIDDRGTERTMELSESDASVPGVDPVADPTYDSDVEADFAARFEALDLDWTLSREPEPLAVDRGTRLMIPDFAFDYRPTGANADGGLRVFFEVMGFWTPAYVEKKLGQLAGVEDVELLVAVDESLAVAEEVADLDHRVVTYSGGVRVKDVVDVLREYESSLVAAAAASLPEELRPDADVVSLEGVAASHGVSADALADVSFPDHERIGRTLCRPAVVDAVDERIEVGQSLSAVESVLDDYGVDDTASMLARLGYRIEWTGLDGGTVAER
jgi:predicted nuclease of restriction endonuclease-like RecB superfamily